jgi:hypothetical protein
MEDLYEDLDPSQPEGGEQQPQGGDQTKAELEALRSEMRELREDATYWRQEAQRGRQQPAEEPEEEDEEEDTEIDIEADLVEMVTSGDKKGFSKAIREVAKKSGFISGKEAQKMIRQTASELAERQRLIEEYPDMQNPKSEFFKVADAHYKRLSARFGDKGIGAIQEAARMAALELERRSSRYDDDEEDYNPRPARRSSRDSEEENRVSRVSRQQGARPGSRDRESEMPAMDRHTKTMLAKLQGIGAPITAEGYMRRAYKDGVQMAGTGPSEPRRGRR